MYMYWHFCTPSSFQSEEQTAKEFSKIVVDAESDYQVRITTISCCSICSFLISELFVDLCVGIKFLREILKFIILKFKEF